MRRLALLSLHSRENPSFMMYHLPKWWLLVEFLLRNYHLSGGSQTVPLKWKRSRAFTREEPPLEGNWKNIFFLLGALLEKQSSIFFKAGKHGAEREAKGINDGSASNAGT